MGKKNAIQDFLAFQALGIARPLKRPQPDIFFMPKQEPCLSCPSPEKKIAFHNAKIDTRV